MLNPLQQKLFLYGLAVVQVEPTVNIHPETWGTPDLQAVQCSGKNWSRLLRYCAPFSPHCEFTVLSPSLTKLSQIRTRQPTRPLIYCQTAFEPLPTPKKLRPLLKRIPLLAQALQPSDPFTPLYWSQPHLGKLIGHLSTMYSITHPQQELLISFQKQHPNSKFFLQANGEIAEQQYLFEKPPALHIPDEYQKKRKILDQYFRGQVQLFKKPLYVFAKDKDRLNWFQRDCLRLLSHPIFFWRIPPTSLPENSSRHIILIHDPDIKFQHLLCGPTPLHLDGNNQTIRYRNYRMGLKAPIEWVQPFTPKAKATLQIKGRQLSFCFTGKGWLSSLNTAFNCQDKSCDLQAKISRVCLLLAKSFT